MTRHRLTALVLVLAGALSACGGAAQSGSRGSTPFTSAAPTPVGGGGSSSASGSVLQLGGTDGGGTADLPPVKPRPRVKPGELTVNGSLPYEVVERIARTRLGKVRECYQRGLERDSRLLGYVRVRFVIGRDSTVGEAVNGGSDLPDAELIDCVVSAFSGEVFPQPDVGTVVVVYPLQLNPPDQ